MEPTGYPPQYRMGQFIVAFSLVLVILQGTVMLLQEPESSWRMWLVAIEPDAPVLAPHEWRGVDMAFRSNGSLPLNGLSVWWSNVSQHQLACLTTIDKASHAPIHCILRQHATQRMHTALPALNPHAVLLALCMIQLIMTISKTQHSRELKQETGTVPRDRNLHVPIGYVLAVLLLVMLTITLLTGIPEPDLLRYPTILILVALFLACGYYCFAFADKADDGYWNLSYHMHVVSVPLAVLSIASAGVRVWTDVLAHGLLLSTAATCLWLQNGLWHPWSTLFTQILTVALPALSYSLAQMQWGAIDTWKYTVGTMGCGGLLPLLLFPLISFNTDNSHQQKRRLRMAHLCTGAALLSMVVNLSSLHRH